MANSIKFIKSYADLVTTHEQTRSGFLKIALEKNAVGDPYVKNALAFKTLVKDVKSPEELMTRLDIRPFMLTAAGLSDKSLNYLNDEEQLMSIKELVDKFLKPAGENFIDETIYRYLLIKGDAVGGAMRNRIGLLGQEKLIRTILSCMNVQGISYKWLPNIPKKSTWIAQNEDDHDIEKNIKAIYWTNLQGQNRVIIFNITIPIVKKNVDICLFDSDDKTDNLAKIVLDVQSAIMLGELKGGYDPAGADEHWKTANTALNRITTSYNACGKKVSTVFIGAAIEQAMAKEIYNQLQTGTLTNAANLTNDEQLVELCNWILSI